MKPFFICSLRLGKGFTAAHAEALCQQMRERVPGVIPCVMTDADPADIPSAATVIPFITDKNDLPGWWCILEAFRVVDCPCIFVGLDTVILDDIQELVDYVQGMNDNEFVMLYPPKPHGKWASGVMAWNGDFKYIFDSVIENPALMQHKRLRQHAGLGFEQDHTSYMLTTNNVKITAAQDVLPGISTYKLNGRPRPIMTQAGPPPGLRLCIFHGSPRPWEAFKFSPWLERYASYEGVPA